MIFYGIFKIIIIIMLFFLGWIMFDIESKKLTLYSIVMLNFLWINLLEDEQ
jgi:hypothetical protein